MRILGVDPGLTRCGLGVVDSTPGRKVVLVAVDVVRTPADQSPHLRLLTVAEALDEWLAEHRPDVVAVERVFAQSNVRSVTGTSQVAGVAMLAAARAHLPLALHTPSEVKAAVTGNGRAEKAQVQEMVRRILGLTSLPRPADAADALALAICHAWRGGGAGSAVRASYGGADTLPRSTGLGLTAAQRAWAEAERAARRAGAVAPKR
ncbi:crossover junction endodeoxyribonuclease RuvC [Georgenia yuyongxinii]|uniref:Crossover junction endodeoxyribonuclease RuvC n=1 Tax=Georgenia yuyongxinii TaxID=2589797 RepID=A0A552WWB5_9MICO|nr:crossover junction endodeoxyribonuclease RuvC [Georgenia yuyongxinii]TRW47084.1 crossover junction endodeoxyribonuclease RuvC [Georgenia yuyongxinii]